MKIDLHRADAKDWRQVAKTFIAARAALPGEVKTQRHQGFSLWTFQQNIRARQFYERHGLMLARTRSGRDNEEGLPDAPYVRRGAESKED